MVSSFGISAVFLMLHRTGRSWGTHQELLATIVFTTVCWVSTAHLGPRTDRQTLIHFYKKVHPFGPGWESIRQEAGPVVIDERDNVPLAMIGWISGVAVVWSGLFIVGNVLYGRTGYAVALTVVFVLSGATLLWVIRRLWK
jgi:hypothetical protein